MFTTGRIIFAISFIIIFAIGMIIAYRKDAKKSPWYFKGATVFWVILILIVANVIFHLFGKS
jgi:predicted membrane protein